MCIVKFLGNKFCRLKVTGTHVHLEITVTRFMQPMPILTPPTLSRFWDRTHSDLPTFCNTIFLQRRSRKDALAPPTWNSERIPQTFSVACRIASAASARRQKTWISSARAINEQDTCHTSPANGQRTPGKWRPTESAVTTHLSCSVKLPIWSPKYSSCTKYMILAVIYM